MARVLFVEDEAALRSALATFLRMQGIEVVEAGSFGAACERIAAEPFDILVTDESLGDGCGSELARRFAPDGERPVLIVTATPERVGLDVLAHEQIEVRRKPLRPAELFAWIRERSMTSQPAGSEGVREIWQRLIREGWAIEEIDRILLVFLDLPRAQLLEIRRDGERLLLQVEAEEPVHWSQVAVDLGIDSWMTQDEDGTRRRIVMLPLPWRGQAARSDVLDLTGCEAWSLERIEGVLQDARERGQRVVHLSSWHRLGLLLSGRRDLISEVFRVPGAALSERHMLWSAAPPSKEIADV